MSVYHPRRGMEIVHIQNLSFQQIKSGVCVVSVFNTGTPPPCSIRILNGIDICNIRPSYLRSFIFLTLVYLRLAFRASEHQFFMFMVE